MPFFSYRKGSLNEHLYVLDKGSCKDISLLEWEIEPLFIFGVDTNISYKRFGINLRLSGALPQETGNMYDSDWKLLNDIKTNYSISENKVNSYIEGELTFDYTFKPSKKFYIKPSFMVGYNRIIFSATNGYGWYGDTISYKDSKAKYYPSGMLSGVDYDLQTIYSFVGSSFVFIPIQRLQIALELLASPMAFVEAKDYHFVGSTSKSVEDADKYMDRGFDYFKRFRGELSATFDINETFAIAGSTGAVIGLPSEIDTFAYSSKKIYEIVNDQKAGTSVQNYFFTLGVKVNVF